MHGTSFHNSGNFHAADNKQLQSDGLRYREGMIRVPKVALLVVHSFAILALLSCGSQAKVETPDDAILGVWRSAASGTTINFSSGGIYSMTLKDQPRPVLGSFTFDPSEKLLVMQTRRESPICADDIGSYKLQIGAQSFDAEVVRDTCAARSKVFAALFERPASSSKKGK